ncbi:MAG: chemotaxis protein CheW [Mariprofundales bacterium]
MPQDIFDEQLQDAVADSDATKARQAFDFDFVDVNYQDVLRLTIGGKELLLSALAVSEVIRPLKLMHVPMAPDHLLGMSNSRGQVVCVIDPNQLMRLSDSEVTRITTGNERFILLRHARMHVSILVDAVSSMHSVRQDAIQDAEKENPTDFTFGNIEIEGESIPLLNVAGFLQ